MANRNIVLTAGAIVGVLVVALSMSISSVVRYSAQAPDPEAGALRSGPVVVAGLAAARGERDREISLREYCRKEVETTEGRELARSMGEEGIIDLCVETARVLLD